MTGDTSFEHSRTSSTAVRIQSSIRRFGRRTPQDEIRVLVPVLVLVLLYDDTKGSFNRRANDSVMEESSTLETIRVRALL